MRRWWAAGWMLLGLLATTPAVAAPAPWSSLELRAIDGRPFETAQLAGHVVLVVNVASFCSYTAQYATLQTLWERYRDRGLVVLGVPSNQFGGQEPGSDAEIKNFCTSRYGVDFPLLTKQEVNGPDRSPLYAFLVGSEVGGGKDVGWNFEKFLVGRDGRVLARFDSHVPPTDGTLRAAVELALSSGSAPTAP